METRKLQWLGLFSELTYDEAHPKLLDSKFVMNSDFIDKLCLYLEKNTVLISFMCWNSDVFDGESIGPEEIISDGAWVWRNDLSHYLKKYHIGLPEEFIDSVLKNPSPRPLTDLEARSVWEGISGKIPLKNDGSSAVKVMGSLQDLLDREAGRVKVTKCR